MAEKVLTSETSSTSSLMNPPCRTICHVCQKQFSQYTCPRCNSRYCSLHCYKSHSLRCTESFMKENVVKELQQVQSDEEMKQKMLDILKRYHLEDETDGFDNMDEDEVNLSEEVIQKVMSGGEVEFDDLSAEEKKRFQRALASGELSKMIEPWDPWWLKPSARTIGLSKEGAQLIQPLAQETPPSPEDDQESDISSGVPPGPESPLPSLSKLSSAEPSPFLAFHLIDIVYSYCFTLRLYNGDWQSDAIGSAMTVLSVSFVLGHGGQPETVSEALSYCLEQTCSPAYRHTGGIQFGLNLWDDVASLLSLGESALICMLCDMKRLIQAAQKQLKLERPKKSGRGEVKTKLMLAERKVYFVTCWVHEQPAEAWSTLAAAVTAEKGSAMDFGVGKGYEKTKEDSDRKSKVLIEEIE